MVGTHDNEPIKMWADAMINTHEGYLHAKNLVEDLDFPDWEDKDALIVELTKMQSFWHRQSSLRFLHQKLKISRFSSQIILTFMTYITDLAPQAMKTGASDFLTTSKNYVR